MQQNLTFAKKVDLASLKSDIEKVDIDKLINVSSGLNNLKSRWFRCFNLKKKLSDAVDRNVLKKSKYKPDKKCLDKK